MYGAAQAGPHRKKRTDMPAMMGMQPGARPVRFRVVREARAMKSLSSSSMAVSSMCTKSRSTAPGTSAPPPPPLVPAVAHLGWSRGTIGKIRGAGGGAAARFRAHGVRAWSSAVRGRRGAVRACLAGAVLRIAAKSSAHVCPSAAARPWAWVRCPRWSQWDVRGAMYRPAIPHRAAADSIHFTSARS